MKYIISILLAFSSLLANAQLTVIVKDSLTEQPVPYANIWVLGENTGTTADENGNFTFNNSVENKKIVLSCVGYERKEVVFNAASKTIFLKRADNLLKEVSVTPRLRNKTLVVNRLNKKAQNIMSANKGFPNITGRYFPHLPKYSETPYLEMIKFHTKSGVKRSRFHVRVFQVDDNGFPNELLHNTAIIGIAKKGKSFTEIDVSDLEIRIPKNGLIVTYEWLIVPENKYTFEYRKPVASGEKTKIVQMKDILYSPNFYNSELREGEAIWRYGKGGWSKEDINSPSINPFSDKKTAVAIELTLSN